MLIDCNVVLRYFMSKNCIKILFANGFPGEKTARETVAFKKVAINIKS